MKLKRAKLILDNMKDCSDGVQACNHRRILKAFKVFWDSEPSEKEFVKYTDGLMITAGMFYYMLKGR